MDRTIVKYLKNKAIIFIESDSMLQKKKKKKKKKKKRKKKKKNGEGKGKKKDRDARFSRPDKANWKGNWNISGLIKSRRRRGISLSMRGLWIPFIL